MIPMMDMFFNPNSATSKAAAKTSQTHGVGDMDAGGALFANLFKGGGDAGMGDPTMFAPAGEEGWKTAVQPAGSMISSTPDGAFAGFNPSMGQLTKTAGKAMQGAAAQMPNGGAFAPPQESQQATSSPTPVLSRTPQPTPDGRQPSWIEKLLG
jgi:hypothetical protein